MRLETEEVELLLGIARDATLGLTFGERLEAIGETLSVLVPVTSLSAVVINPKAPSESLAANAYFRNGSVESVVTYVTNYIPDDPMNPALGEANGVPVLLSDYITSRQFGRDAYTGEFLPKYGLRHLLGCASRMPDGGVLAFALHREPPLGDFTPREREFMRLVSPDITRAAYGAILQEKIKQARSRPRDQAGTCTGTILFDSSGELLYCDRGAFVLLDRLKVTSGLLGADVLMADVRHAARCPDAITIRFYPLVNGGWLRATFSCFETEGQKILAGLSTVEQGSRDLFDALARRAHLTSREREIAALAIQGLGNRDIARRLGISTVTVGVHLTHVYAKTGVTSKNELTALMLGAAPGAA